MNDNTCGHECCSPDLEDGCTVDKCIDHPHTPPILDPGKPVPINVAMNLARREYAAGLRQGDQRLADALARLVAVSPTTIPASEDCRACHHGTINVGTAIDPEAGPCPSCRCEWHREPHRDCFEFARAILAARDRT